MLYDGVLAHPLLEGDALWLSPEEIQEQAALAERLLGLRGQGAVLFTGEQGLDATRAVVLQINLQAAQDPEAYLAQSVGRGSESITYREGKPIHPHALDLVSQLYGEAEPEPEGSRAWPVTRSFRR